MSKIKIKNFGPVKTGFSGDDGFMDIKKVSVFIGNQGSGKSTVAKLITTFMWIEKALTRGDYDIKWFTKKSKLRNQFLKYFRLENYFPNAETENETFIEYRGDSYNIKYEYGNLYIEDAKNGSYPLPQIMYVPAERNFIANVKNPKALKLTSDSMVEFVTEFDNAKNEIKGSIAFPVNQVEVEYHKVNDVVYIKGNGYKIKLTEASSGFQSSVPLYLVSWFLSNSVRRQSENAKEPMTSEQRERFRKQVQLITDNEDLTDEQKRIAISEEAKRFNKTAFINIVEEPEQNLFPTSQAQVLNSLLEFNNMNKGNKLIITTHSPYIINYLTIAIKGSSLLKEISNSNKSDLKRKLNEIVPTESCVASDDVIVYELSDRGEISKLKNYEGIPSDENFLNHFLSETNQLFDALLEIEESL